MKTALHTVNGRRYGTWYLLDDGRVVYLAQRRKRDLFLAKSAWCIDLLTLRHAKTLGACAVGVIVGKGKTKQIYLTTLDAFFEHPLSFSHFGDTAQRGLPINCFLIHPGKSSKRIEKSIKIR